MTTAKELHTLVITFLILILATSAVAAKPTKTSTNFIKSSCQATLYPTLCVHSLALYASSIKFSPHKLTHTALLVSLAKAKSTRTYISILAKTNGLSRPDRAALKDCLDNMANSENRLRESVQEMGRLSKATASQFKWRMSNVQTWVSAALTGENTCGDGLGVSLVSRKVSPMVNNVKQVTSNALALINQFVDSKY